MKDRIQVLSTAPETLASILAITYMHSTIQVLLLLAQQIHLWLLNAEHVIYLSLTLDKTSSLTSDIFVVKRVNEILPRGARQHFPRPRCSPTLPNSHLRNSAARELLHYFHFPFWFLCIHVFFMVNKLIRPLKTAGGSCDQSAIRSFQMSSFEDWTENYERSELPPGYLILPQFI